MLKKIFLFGLLALLGLVSAVQAATLDATNNGATEDSFYPATWDNLVLDFTLKQTGATADDTLLALTLKNNGSARNDFEITVVKLWSDAASTGWQGWGYDTLVATASYSGDYWYFDNLRVVMPTAGLRLFVTLDVRSSITTKKTVNFYIPELTDSNGNGLYNSGDQGIFTASGINGPTSSFSNEKLQSISNNNYDVWPPEAVITNIKSGDVLTGAASFTVKGEARDQGSSKLEWVKVGIGQNENNLTWSNVSDTGNNYATWEYNWQNSTPGSYVLATQARDSSGNLSNISYQINNLTVTAPPPEPEHYSNGDLVQAKDSTTIYSISGGKKCLIPTDAIFASWGYDRAKVKADQNNGLGQLAVGEAVKFRDGSLVKSDGSKVYVISEGKKRWITSGEIFTGLGYKWSKIYVTTDVELNNYPLGIDVNNTYAHPMGTIVKYTTYPEVFLLDSGQRRHIVDEATFNGLGYLWDSLIVVPDWEYYPDGKEITL